MAEILFCLFCPEPEIFLGSQYHDDAVLDNKHLGLRGNGEMSRLPLFLLMLGREMESGKRKGGKGKGGRGREEKG